MRHVFLRYLVESFDCPGSFNKIFLEPSINPPHYLLSDVSSHSSTSEDLFLAIISFFFPHLSLSLSLSLPLSFPQASASQFLNRSCCFFDDNETLKCFSFSLHFSCSELLTLDRWCLNPLPVRLGRYYSCLKLVFWFVCMCSDFEFSTVSDWIQPQLRVYATVFYSDILF